MDNLEMVGFIDHYSMINSQSLQIQIVVVKQIKIPCQYSEEQLIFEKTRKEIYDNSGG